MDENENLNLFRALPIEMLEEVLHKLSKKDLLKCRLVSSEWNIESSRCLREKLNTVRLEKHLLKLIENQNNDRPFPFSKVDYHYSEPVEEEFALKLRDFCEKYGQNIKCLKILTHYFENHNDDTCSFFLLLEFATQINTLILDGESHTHVKFTLSEPYVSYYFPPSIKFESLKILKISLFVNYYEDAIWNHEIFCKIVKRAQFLHEIHLMVLFNVRISEKLEKCSKFKELVNVITESSASVLKLHLKYPVDMKMKALVHYMKNPNFSTRIQEINITGYYRNIIPYFTVEWEEAFPNVTSLISYGSGYDFHTEGIYYFKNVKVLKLHGIRYSLWDSFTGEANETQFMHFIENELKNEEERSDFIETANRNMKGLGELKRLEKLTLSFFDGDEVRSSINSLVYLAHFTKIKPLELLSLKYDRKYFRDFENEETSYFLILLKSFHKNVIIDSVSMLPKDLPELLEGVSF